MTPGIASRAMQANRCLQEVTHLIIDEVHERDIETEILLLLVKSLMARNPSIKIILMSATFEMDSLKKYFSDCKLVNSGTLGSSLLDYNEIFKLVGASINSK